MTATSVQETPRKELRRMNWAALHITRMSPAGRRWVRAWLLTKYDEEGNERW